MREQIYFLVGVGLFVLGFLEKNLAKILVGGFLFPDNIMKILKRIEK